MFKIELEKEEYIAKCIRFPAYLVDEINKVKGKDIAFSKFVIEACKYALENMEDN